MRRRDLLGALGAAVSWPITVRAQQPGKLPTIGFLGAGTPATMGKWPAAFVQRLGELGWVEGRTVAIEYRWTDGNSARAAEAAAEFVSTKVNVILTSGTPIILAAKRTTSEIPIVFAAAGDPVGTGLVASLARPSNNLTGLSVEATDLAGKHVELLRDVRPGLRRLAILVNSGSPNAVVQTREMKAAAGTLGYDVNVRNIASAEDIEPAIAALKGNADALFVTNDPLTVTNRVRINTLALGAKLPTVYAFREFVDAGGLMSYGPIYTDLFRRAADYVDKILRGAKPSDLPVEQPTKFELVINLKTAKALGIAVPQTLLARADEVIE